VHRLAIAALVLASCGKRSSESQPANGSGSGGDDGWRELARFDTDVKLLGGLDDVAVVENLSWFMFDGGKLRPRKMAPDGQRCADASTEAGGEEPEVFYGNQPLIACGDEHRVRAYRFTAGELEVPGPIQQVVGFRKGAEAWHYLDRLTSRIAIVERDGTITPEPPFERVGPAVEGESPVRTKACASPSILDLASNGETVVALVTECSPEAPVRVASLNLPGRPSYTTTLATPAKLGFQPDQVAISLDGRVVIAGIADGKLATMRVDGEQKRELGPGPASQVIEMVITSSGEVWALTLGARGKASEWILTRDRVVVPLPPGLHAEALAYDRQLGVVVKAVGNGKHWIFALSSRS
jgi:hypothetical protein